MNKEPVPTWMLLSSSEHKIKIIKSQDLSSGTRERKCYQWVLNQSFYSASYTDKLHTHL